MSEFYPVCEDKTWGEKSNFKYLTSKFCSGLRRADDDFSSSLWFDVTQVDEILKNKYNKWQKDTHSFKFLIFKSGF